MNLHIEVNIKTEKSFDNLLTIGVLLVWLFLLTLPRATAADDSSNLAVHVGQRVEITSSYRYCWFPTVHQFSTGEILATVRMSPDEMHPEGEFSAYCISRDGGQTWSPRQVMGAGANVDDTYTQATRQDGTVWVLGAGYDSLEPYPPGQAQDFHATLTKYSRGGMEVDQVRDAVIHLSQPVLMAPADLYDRHVKDASKLVKVPDADPWGAILEGSNRDWLATVYYNTEEPHRQRRLVVIRSTDKGRSWNEDATIAAVTPNDKTVPWMGKEGPDESAIVRLADGRYYCIFRTAGGEGDEGFMGEAWSTDTDGHAWTRPLSTGLKGVAPHLRMMSNGVLACSYGRPGPVTAMFSVDGTGKKWTNLTPIFSGMSTRYTDLIEVSPGKLFVIYDSVPYGWDAIPDSDTVSRNTIYGTFIEVRKR